MRRALLSTALFLVMAFPAVAADPKGESDKLTAKYMEFFNNKDAAGITSLFTKDYMRVVPSGVVDNTKYYEEAFKAGMTKLESKTIEAAAVTENVITAMGEAKVTGKNDKGEPLEANALWSSVSVREGDVWKIKQLTSFPKPAAK
jgi:ketosteroid isomerase-like protein